MKQLLLLSYFLAFETVLALVRPDLGCGFATGNALDIDYARARGQPNGNLPSSPLERLYGVAYYVNLTIGYPPQPVSLLLDTGSSDTWATSPIACKKFCETCPFPTYDVSTSKSFVPIENNIAFFEEYAVPDKVCGFFASDVFTLGDVAIFNVSFGVVNQTSEKPSTRGGILAMGLDGFQNIALTPPGAPISGFLDQIKATGIISSLSFGIFLGGQYFSDLTPGEIIFGGVNSSRFSGPLVPLPLAPSPDQFARLQVWLSSVSLTVDGKTTELPPDTTNILGTSITVDTGDSFTNLPDNMYNELLKVLGVNPKTKIIDCRYLFGDGSLKFSFYGFNGKYSNIKVPLRYIIQWVSGDQCQLTVQNELDCSRGGGIEYTCASLGADFLRAAYLYVNYDNLTIGLAQAVYENPIVWPVEMKQLSAFDQARFIVQ